MVAAHALRSARHAASTDVSAGALQCGTPDRAASTVWRACAAVRDGAACAGSKAIMSGLSCV
ncbi:hypothetical protein XCR_3088 [Xanthomonas campestris pv. raphani 756C]|nr:hypothetical protein XCR_3088 [Xanthomonas campestris pv. raphani 756C]